MKKIITIIMCSVSLFSFAEEGSAVKDNVSNKVSDMVSFGKDALSGVQEGIDKGRKEGESLDGALIISDQKSLSQYDVSLSIYKVKKLTDSSYELVMAIRNNESKPIRLTSLSSSLKIILLDNDGFASNLDSRVGDITVPEKAAVRSTWRFDEVEGKPDVLRIFGKEIKITFNE